MLPSEVVEELSGGLRATGFQVLATLANTFNSFLVVLTLPFEVLGQNVIKRFSGAHERSVDFESAGSAPSPT